MRAKLWTLIKGVVSFLFFFGAFVGLATDLGRLVGLDANTIRMGLWLLILVILSLAVLTALALGGLFLYRIRSSRRYASDAGQRSFERIEPLYDAIENDDDLTREFVHPFAADPATRVSAYQLLTENRLAWLFPAEYEDLVHAAEGYLVNWLEFPNELDAVPDEIEHVERVTIPFDGNNVYYEVFKFRVNQPHWAAEEGWMLGVVGPYFDDSKPFDHPSATFSRLSSKFGEISAADEAEWVHENITMR